jgi:methionine-rich copper-binding protein CopC
VFAASVAQVVAHAELVNSEPAPGAQLSSSPAEIRLTFSEPVGTGRIILLSDGFDPVDGLDVQSDEEHPEVIFTTLPALAAGSYTVQWSAIGADGHEVAGSYSFAIGSDDAGDDSSLTRNIGLGIVGLAVLMAIMAARRSRSQSG